MNFKINYYLCIRKLKNCSVEVDGEWFLDGGCEFFLQRIHELRYPTAPVIVVAVTYKNVILKPVYDRRHNDLSLDEGLSTEAKRWWMSYSKLGIIEDITILVDGGQFPVFSKNFYPQ